MYYLVYYLVYYLGYHLGYFLWHHEPPKDDQHRNTNINNKDDIVGQLTWENLNDGLHPIELFWTAKHTIIEYSL